MGGHDFYRAHPAPQFAAHASPRLARQGVIMERRRNQRHTEWQSVALKPGRNRDGRAAEEVTKLV